MPRFAEAGKSTARNCLLLSPFPGGEQESPGVTTGSARRHRGDRDRRKGASGAAEALGRPRSEGRRLSSPAHLQRAKRTADRGEDGRGSAKLAGPALLSYGQEAPKGRKPFGRRRFSKISGKTRFARTLPPPDPGTSGSPPKPSTPPTTPMAKHEPDISDATFPGATAIRDARCAKGSHSAMIQIPESASAGRRYGKRDHER